MNSTRERIAKEVKVYLAYSLPINKDIKERDSLKTDLKMDFLDFLELVMEIEDSFGVDLEDEEFGKKEFYDYKSDQIPENVKTIKDFINIVEKIINK